ncbi:uncharacterized protein EMH_0067760 [Eimeria mitis]|uniref:Uncharacterized protein n=1 Tax=Eimeria mitis TaxID=44415 RepID=U6KHA1_9EIME|nr:uncharacterized protein EMH_0067760 [Eimeria mitis]CDJ36176.1 hypothetical protein EMH_0067760 [Eimeria mitis]
MQRYNDLKPTSATAAATGTTGIMDPADASVQKQLQQQMQQQQQQEEKRKAIEEQRRIAMKSLLSPEAQERRK